MVNPLLFPRSAALALLLLLGSLASGHAVTLLPQEQAIANYLATTPGQGRPYLVLDPTIEQVARARALDMATRNYFAEINPEGLGTNYLLRAAGYQLPAWWGSTPSANYVESIAAGSPSPSVTWTAWMNSPPHKEHLLAQVPFYATETHYGIGYAYNPNSTYQYYWVVVTAPPEPVEIMSPEPSQILTSASVPLTGLADGTTGAVSVQYRVENSTGTSGYQVAEGVENWSGTATLSPGANVIRAESLDGSGNVIDQTVVNVRYVAEGTLTVTVSGSGSVTSGFEGITSHPIGNTISLAATPAPGSIFTGWTGSVTSGSTLITFPMASTVNLKANFAPNPFTDLAGSYYGILTARSGASSGVVTLTVSAGGSFTGSIMLDGNSLPISGRLSADGYASISIPSTPWTVTLQAGGGLISGTLSDDAASYTLSLSQSSYAAGSNPAPEAGTYTLALAPDTTLSSTSAPQGCGCATLLVGPAGGAMLAGHMANGSAFSASGRVAQNGTLALYFVPTGAIAGSSVTGMLTFQSTSVSDLAGTLTWTMPPNGASPYYPSGFVAQLQAVGSRYTPPGPGKDPLGSAPGPATLTLAGGGLALTNIPMLVHLSGVVTMAVPGPADAAISLSATTGALSGSFHLPGGAGARAVEGIILQKQNAAFGFFRDTIQFGNLSLAPGS